jgi:hypothetical protein
MINSMIAMQTAMPKPRISPNRWPSVTAPPTMVLTPSTAMKLAARVIQGSRTPSHNQPRPSCFLAAVSLASFTTPATADDDFLKQAQPLFDKRGDDRDAYQRGREDEMRRHEAERDWSRNQREDWSRDERYRQPYYGVRM